jgi:hypothetical protein
VDEDGWDDDQEDETGDEETIPCPHCKRQIHEDAQRCPHCGNYISEEDAPPSRKPWWIIVGVVLILYIAYRWIRG